MKKLPALIGAAFLIAFNCVSAQPHADGHGDHAGHGRVEHMPMRPPHAEVHARPAVVIMPGSHASYGHGAAVREQHREWRHESDHGRRGHESRRHETYSHRSRDH